MKHIEDYKEAFTVNQYMVRMGDGTILLHFGDRNYVYAYEYGSEEIACCKWERFMDFLNPDKIEHYCDRFNHYQYMTRHSDGSVLVTINSGQRWFDNEPEACAYFKLCTDPIKL